MAQIPGKGQKNHMSVHDGHRSRMRERFRQGGLEGFASHEIVELLLFYAKARGDVNPLAHELLEVFGSFKGLLEATTEQLMAVPGVGLETATLISLILPMFRRYQESLCDEEKRIRNYGEMRRYCVALMAGLRSERLYVISLSSAMKIVGRRMLAEGSLTEVSVTSRQVVEAALNHNALAVVLCHNHPGGIAEPSTADLEWTWQAEQALMHIGIRLVDHIIVAGETTYSMSQHDQLLRSSRGKMEGSECNQELLWDMLPSDDEE